MDGNRIEQSIGLADDDGAGFGALTYRAAVTAALDWSRQQHAAIEARDGEKSSAPTVRSAINAYVKTRQRVSGRNGANASGRLARHVLSDKEFADTPLTKLRSSHLDAWRSRLPILDGQRVEADSTDRDADSEDAAFITPATVNRLMNDLRAALNAAVEKHRRELPAALPLEIKVGSRAIPASSNARKQILTDQQIAKLIKAAYEIDEDFGQLVLISAATGARHAQIRALTVGDVQPDRLRVMMPGARKGRSAKAKPPVAVPLGADVLDRLSVCLDGRDAAEPLLTRWAYRNVGPLKWEKDHRRAWGPAYEVDKPWAATVECAGVPSDTIMYAFRHSSIVRGLRHGLPVRLVAALHDTSSEMIERFYSAHVVDATEEISRRSVLSLT
ncbi:integrase [Mesorhizobium sp. 8]|nr:integrase [Mesorhizobium sp. 8]